MNRRSFLFTLPLAGSATGAMPDKPELTLGVIADPQYADKDPRGSRHYRASIDKLRRCIEDLNRHPLDAVVTLGDFIDEDFASFAPVMEVYEGLKAPHLKVLGNHDFTIAQDKKQDVIPALGLKSGYSSKVIGNHRIILLDGTEVSSFRPEEEEAANKFLAKMKQENRKNGKFYNGGLSSTQFNWLEKELEATTAAKQRALLCCHYPILPADPHNLWNDLEVIELIDRFPCVATWFNGHNHKGNYATRKHCHFVNFKGMVETANDSAYAVVRCFPDRIEIEGFDTEPDRHLKATP